jgi:hypothetical protein
MVFEGSVMRARNVLRPGVEIFFVTCPPELKSRGQQIL